MLPMRIGHGYDVHQLVENRKLIIGGVDIPHHLGLLGHSDADVLLHAICDAILGALGAGDIGQHFPDNDSQFAGICSLKLLDQVIHLATKSGWRVGNIDTTIVAQQPKMSPYLTAMQQNIANCCVVPATQINVKATTTEQLGFTGRQEGIAAHAVVILVSHSVQSERKVIAQL